MAQEVKCIYIYRWENVPSFIREELEASGINGGSYIIVTHKDLLAYPWPEPIRRACLFPENGEYILNWGQAGRVSLKNGDLAIVY
jgi:hypothetical protein